MLTQVNGQTSLRRRDANQHKLSPGAKDAKALFNQLRDARRVQEDGRPTGEHRANALCQAGAARSRVNDVRCTKLLRQLQPGIYEINGNDRLTLADLRRLFSGYMAGQYCDSPGINKSRKIFPTKREAIPTPPIPRITTVSSDAAFATCCTAPIPVWNPQPRGAKSNSSDSS